MKGFGKMMALAAVAAACAAAGTRASMSGSEGQLFGAPAGVGAAVAESGVVEARPHGLKIVDGEPALGGSFSQAGMDYLVRTVLPIVAQRLLNTTFPPISGEKDGFEYSLDNVGISTMYVNTTASGLTSVPGEGLQATLMDIAVDMSGDWSFKLHSWPHIPYGSGSVDADVSGTTISLLIDVMEGVDGTIAVSASDIVVSFGDWNIDPHGSNWDFLIDLLKDIFKGDIQNALQNEFESLISEVVNVDANNALANVPLAIHLPFKAPWNGSELELNLTSNATFGSGYVGIFLLGEAVNIANPVPAPFPAPTVPQFDASAADHYLQLVVSPYTVETLVYSFYSAGVVDFNVTHNDIPSSFPVTLNTTWLGLAAPEMPTKYPNMWVQVEVEESGIAEMVVTSSGFNATIPVELAFQPTDDVNVYDGFVLGCNLTTAIYLSVEVNTTNTTTQQVLHGNMSYLTCPLELISSDVGEVHYSLLADLIDFIFPDIILPVVNDVLEPGVPLPSFDNVTFTNTEILYGTDYAILATDFVYTPPTPSFPLMAKPHPIPEPEPAFRAFRGPQ